MISDDEVADDVCWIPNSTLIAIALLPSDDVWIVDAASTAQPTFLDGEPLRQIRLNYDPEDSLSEDIETDLKPKVDLRLCCSRSGTILLLHDTHFGVASWSLSSRSDDGIPK